MLVALPRLAIFGLALCNFVSLWRNSNEFIGIACVVCSWYFDWSYTNDPSLLLLAASFLLIGKWWSNLVSSALSVYILKKATYLINSFGWSEWLESLVRQWKITQEYETGILEIFEIQLILALIIWGLSAFYLFRGALYKSTSQGKYL